MPRKSNKSSRPPLSFREYPLGSAKLKNEPEVRAALNPRLFFTDEPAHNNGAAPHSWITPEFSTSTLAEPPVRRGRRGCHQSTTTVLERSSQISRKTTVCKYPSLTFDARTEKPRQICSKTATEYLANRPRRSRLLKCTASEIGRERHVEQGDLSDAAVSTSRCLRTQGTSSIHVAKRHHIPKPTANAAASASASPASALRTPDVSELCSPPHVDTPNITHDDSIRPSSSFTSLLAPKSPLFNRLPDILVTDTPERDYGVKVAWRRRRPFMMVMKEKGHLSDSDVLIHC